MNIRLHLIAVAFGLAFGFVLAWAGMTDPERIRDMLLMRSVDLFLVMGAAATTGFITIRVLRSIGARSVLGRAPLTALAGPPTRETVVGSAIFGFGWSVACTCPGPVAAQIGTGQVLAVVVVVGILLGAHAARSKPAIATAR